MCRCGELTSALLWMLGACGSGTGFPDAAPSMAPDPGSFSLAWSITTAAGQPATCAEVGATLVHIGIMDDTSGERSSGSFDCGLGTAVSGAVFASSYDISFALLGMSGTIATAATQTTVVMPDRTTPLAAVTFVAP